MKIHVFKFSSLIKSEEQREMVKRIKSAILDELLRLHGRIAFGAMYVDRHDDSQIGDAQLSLDAGPWACSMGIYLMDEFTNTTSNITFKVIMDDFGALPGKAEAQYPGMDRESYGVVGYISLNYTGALIVQLLVLDEPAEDDALPSWNADPSAADFQSMWLPENETFYGTIER